MRAGLFLAYWPWFEPQEQIDLAVLADELGIDSVWIAESWGQDCVSVLGLLAGRTERVGLGTAIMQIPARKPTAAAMAAATLDVLSNGRMRLGLGLSGPQVSEGWYGEPFVRGLARTRDYVDVVRRALAGEPIQLPLPEGQEGLGLGKPLKLLARPVQERLPIYLGVNGPKALRQAGEIADGWIPFLFDPAQADSALAPLREGLQAAGRTLDGFDIAAGVPFAVDDDLDRARDAVRPWVAFYFGAMGAKGKNFYVENAERNGFGDVAHEVQDRWLAGDRQAAAAALTPELLDATTLATTPALLDDRLAAYERAGITTLLAVPCGDRPRTVRALAHATAS
jgi:F420-dependent oxidoreductase-like protein